MKSRYYLLLILIGGVSVLWAAYLFVIQVLDPFEMGGYRRLRYTPQKEILIPKRGAILDANGNLLVSSISYYQIDIDRDAVNRWAKRKDIALQDAYRQIANVLSENSELTLEQVMGRLNRNDKLTSIQISNKIKESELDQIIRVFEEHQRLQLDAPHIFQRQAGWQIAGCRKRKIQWL